MGTWDSMIALGRELQGLGYDVSENPLFGGVSPTAHTKGSKHYTARGDALDINFDGHGQAFEDSKLNAVVPMAKALGLRVIWQYSGHYNHLHVDTSTGPDLGNIGAAYQATPAGPLPSGAGTSAPAVDAAWGLPSAPGVSLDEIGNTIGKALIIGSVLVAGAGLVLLGLNKATGNPAAKIVAATGAPDPLAL